MPTIHTVRRPVSAVCWAPAATVSPRAVTAAATAFVASAMTPNASMESPDASSSAVALAPAVPWRYNPIIRVSMAMKSSKPLVARPSRVRSPPVRADPEIPAKSARSAATESRNSLRCPTVSSSAPGTPRAKSNA